MNKGQTIFKLQHDQYYGNDRIPAAISFISPGIVPLMNPSYRIYQYSNTLLIDFTHYISKQSHTIENHEVSFQPSYSFREAYNVPDLSPISVFNILNRLNHDETLWREYLKRVVSLRSKYYGDWNHKIWSKVLSKICDSEISCPAVP